MAAFQLSNFKRQLQKLLSSDDRVRCLIPGVDHIEGDNMMVWSERFNRSIKVSMKDTEPELSNHPRKGWYVQTTKGLLAKESIQMETTNEILDNLMNTTNESSPLDFVNAFDTAMKYKCAELIDGRKSELAATMGVREETSDDDDDDDYEKKKTPFAKKESDEDDGEAEDVDESDDDYEEDASDDDDESYDDSEKKINEAASDNFYIFTDTDGKMPGLTRKSPPLYKPYVKYVANKPVEVKPYPGQKMLWDYSKQKYVDISTVKNIN